MNFEAVTNSELVEKYHLLSAISTGLEPALLCTAIGHKGSAWKKNVCETNLKSISALVI